uniref:Enoyl-CoA hydratase n=1 Tax=Panagrellus redivivus TaxID=6233 RepID=A0A7E4UX00_PANRE
MTTCLSLKLFGVSGLVNSVTRQMATKAKQNVVLSVIEPRILHISINRPEKKNCVNHATALELISAFDRLNNDDGIDVAVLSGQGATFCAGYDLSTVADGTRPSGDAAAGHLAAGHRFMGPTGTNPIKKPVIAAIEGHAVAGGLELAMLADLRVAAKSASFGVLCRRFGVPLIDGGTVRLPAAIGYSRAMDLILTGRAIDAETAYSWGLVNRLVADGTALESAVQLAKDLLAFPQACMRADRESAFRATFDNGDFASKLDFELTNGLPVLEEAAKGAKTFISKSYKVNPNKPKL